MLHRCLAARAKRITWRPCLSCSDSSIRTTVVGRAVRRGAPLEEGIVVDIALMHCILLSSIEYIAVLSTETRGVVFPERSVKRNTKICRSMLPA